MGVKACTIAAYIDASETGTPGPLSAGTPSDGFTISANPANATTGLQMRLGTGTATSINVIGSQRLSLAAAAQEIDLSALGTALGTKSFAKVRGLIFQNLADAESGHSVAIEAGASSGFTPFLSGTTPALVIPSQGVYLLLNPQVAAWTRDSSHKSLKFDPGANTMDFIVGVVGE